MAATLRIKGKMERGAGASASAGTLSPRSGSQIIAASPAMLLMEEIVQLEEKVKSIQEKIKEKNQQTEELAQSNVRVRRFANSRLGGLETELSLAEKKLQQRREQYAAVKEKEPKDSPAIALDLAPPPAGSYLLIIS